MKKTLYLYPLLFINWGVFAQTPMLVNDLIGLSASPNRPLTSNSNGIVFFAANNGTTGQELWKSDGMSLGTVMVHDINSGSSNSNPTEITAFGSGTVFFNANDGVNGHELWKSGGLASNTTLVKDIVAGSTGSNPRNLKVFNNTLYFSANNNYELWKSSGTGQGTVIVKTIAAPDFISKIIPSGNILYFTVYLANSGGEQLWKTDGTAGGTVMVKEFTYHSTSGHITVNNTLFFAGNDNISGYELWKSDGTTAGTVMVKDLGSGSFGIFPAYLTELNNNVYFSASGSLWKSDGTDAGTVAISSLSGTLANMNGVLYIANYADGIDIYKSDGTAAGTVFLKHADRYDNISSNPAFVFFNNLVYFNYKEPQFGEELWRTNGTQQVTQLDTDIRNGSYGSYPGNFLVVSGSLNDVLYFTASDGTNGFELWKKEGNGNAMLVKNIEPDNFDSNPANLAKLNQMLFYSATDQYSTHLFALDTSQPSPFNQGLGPKSPSGFLAFNNKMYFQGDMNSGKELCVSDGTTNNTMVVKDIYTGATGGGGTQNSSNPAELTTVGSQFYFAATSTGNDRELWKSDGTETGTVIVKNISTGGSSSPTNLIEFNSLLYFFATSASIIRLWKSDGTSAGTTEVPISFGSYSIDQKQIGKTSNKLFFTGYSNSPTNAIGNELYVLNGTSVQLVRDIYTGTSGLDPNSSNPRSFTAINDILYFVADNNLNGTEIWKSDGTLAGTVILKDIRTGLGGSSPQHLINFNGTLYFSANSGSGQELWKSDGTESGTVLVKDINLGNGDSSPGEFCVIGNILYFKATHPRFGTELWKTDGTAEGTVLVYDLYEDFNAESNDANPSNLFNMNGTLYFAADNGFVGNELFYYKPCPSTQAFNQYAFLPSQTFHTSQTITAVNKISRGKVVNYFAGKSVLLSPGFKVSADDVTSTNKNVFRAEVRGCN